MAQGNYEAALPFMKWAGGKRQLKNKIHAAFPADFDLAQHRYFEPFLGGGAIMWSLAELLDPSVDLHAMDGPRIIVNDINSRLIAAYGTVKSDVKSLIKMLKQMEKSTTKEDYLEVRDWDIDNMSDLEKAAWMIYLNKTGFNGMYRENASGKFNIPWGQKSNPTVCDEQRLLDCSAFLQHCNVEFRNVGVAEAVADAAEGDLVYLDPPYIPMSDTAAFTSYSKAGFGEADQRDLAKLVSELKEKGARVIFSNNDTPLTREIYDQDYYKADGEEKNTLELRVVSAARSLGASKASRARVNEVLGISFDTGTKGGAAENVFENLERDPSGFIKTEADPEEPADSASDS